MALVPESLQQLGYAQEWLEFGLLDEELFRAQLDAYRRGEDRHTEHYRWAAFRGLLGRKNLDDGLVERFLILAERDPDRSMATSAVTALLEHPALSEVSLEKVAASPLCHPRFRSRTRLLRALREGPPSRELLQACVDCNEPQVHRALLALPAIDREWVEQLAQQGATRALRNQAGQRLRGLDAQR